MISMEKNDFNKNSDNLIGKLKSNFTGTKFHIYNAGEKPSAKQVPAEMIRNELGLIKYVW